MLLHCDNALVVHIMAHFVSHSMAMMVLVWYFTMLVMQHNTDIWDNTAPALAMVSLIHSLMPNTDASTSWPRDRSCYDPH